MAKKGKWVFVKEDQSVVETRVLTALHKLKPEEPACTKKSSTVHSGCGGYSGCGGGGCGR